MHNLCKGSQAVPIHFYNFHFYLRFIKLYEKLMEEFFNTIIREEWKETEGKNILVSRSNQVIQFGENWLI